MFKLLILLIIIFLISVSIYCFYKAFNHSFITKEGGKGLDVYIENLKKAIIDLEMKAVIGLENAEAKLIEYQELLKKAELFKQKTKDL